MLEGIITGIREVNNFKGHENTLNLLLLFPRHLEVNGLFRAARELVSGRSRPQNSVSTVKKQTSSTFSSLKLLSPTEGKTGSKSTFGTSVEIRSMYPPD